MIDYQNIVRLHDEIIYTSIGFEIDILFYTYFTYFVFFILFCLQVFLFFLMFVYFIFALRGCIDVQIKI